MLADQGRGFEPRSAFTRTEGEEEGQPSYSQYYTEADNVTVNEYSETCTGEDCKDWMVKIKDFSYEQWYEFFFLSRLYTIAEIR